MNGNIYVKEIYINNKPLILTNAAERYVSKNTQSAGYLLLSGAFARNLRLAKKHLEKVSSTGAIIHDISNDALEALLAETYTDIKAAGGLVINEEGKLLLIFRRGFWDLPKGKLDNNESEKDAAIREVMEETGLKSVEAHDKIKTSFHIYEEKNKTVLKTTYWFDMKSANQVLIPQLEEDILIAKWVDKTEASLLMNQSYAIVKKLVTEHFIKH